MNEERTTSRKTRVGKVVSDKMDKTVVVIVEDRVAHKTYKKIIGRTYRLKAALLTFAGDAAKAALAVLLGRYLAGLEGGCVAAVFAIVGHMWPLYFGFRGGKGIACTVGAIAVLYPILLVPLVILWGVPVLCSRCISLGSIIAALGLTPAVALWCHGQAVELVFPVGGAAVMTLLILLAHRENMVRLARGEENKI